MPTSTICKPAFFKPLPGMGDTEILFLLKDPALNGQICFRSLSLETDMDLVYDWVNQPYAIRYWQMNGDWETLVTAYKTILENPLAHSFIGLFNDRIVCQIDCYQASADELKDHVQTGPGVCGFHILMCPPRQSVKGLTEAMLRAFVKFFFSFGAAQVLYGEPDINNSPANIVARRAGFQFQKTIQLSYKTANLYSITRQQFFQSIQLP